MAATIWDGLSQQQLKQVVKDIRAKLHGESDLEWNEIC